jgi:hypothetical protein
MSDIVDAFLAGRNRVQESFNKSDPFQRGVAWVETVLEPGLKLGR